MTSLASEIHAVFDSYETELKSLRAELAHLQNDERAAAILLRNPSNFDALVEAFNTSSETSVRGKLDDALKSVAALRAAEQVKA